MRRKKATFLAKDFNFKDWQRPERPVELRHAGRVVLTGDAALGTGQADVEQGVAGGARHEGVRVGHLHQAAVEVVLGSCRVEPLLTLTGVSSSHPAVSGLEGALTGEICIIGLMVGSGWSMSSYLVLCWTSRYEFVF